MPIGGRLYAGTDHETVVQESVFTRHGVDRVLRYERLEEELGALFEELGVPFEHGLNVHAKAGHRRDRRPYRECYTDRQRELVAEAFAWEIETFGYEF